MRSVLCGPVGRKVERAEAIDGRVSRCSRWKREKKAAKRKLIDGAAMSICVGQQGAVPSL